MEAAVSNEDEPTLQQTSQNQTLHITTRVADIRLTAVLSSSDQHDSSDEEVIEALSLCHSPNTCNNHWHFILHFMFS